MIVIEQYFTIYNIKKFITDLKSLIISIVTGYGQQVILMSFSSCYLALMTSWL